MKRKTCSRLLSILLAMALICTLLPAAFAAEGPALDPLPRSGDITLSISGESSVQEGASVTLSVSASGTGDTTMSGIIWTVSGGPDCARIDGDAGQASVTVSGLKAGQATITCSATVGQQPYSASHVLTVTPAVIPVDGVSLNKTALELKKGNSETLSAVITPGNATDQSLHWSSDHPEFATVENGRVTAVAAGTAVITVAAGNSGKTATCTVTVTEDPPAPSASIAVSPTQLTLAVGGSDTLAAAVIPAGAPIAWSVDNGTVAAVDQSGKVTALNPGNASVTAKINVNGVEYTSNCAVTVSAPPAAPTLSNTALSLNVGKSSTLTVNGLPAGAAVAWNSNKTSVATVSNGTVTGRSEGSAVITATVSGGGLTAPVALSCTVTVVKGGVSTISYTVALDKTLTLDRSDFNSVCSNVYGNTLDYVKFDRNSSKGTLYFDYNTDDGGAKISTSTAYSYATDAKKPISRITFVPDGNSGDVATFTYTGWDSAGKNYNGTLEIKLTAPSGDISYETGKNEALTFIDSDFNSICKKITGASLDYVTFGSVSSSRGTLYLDYGGSDQKKLSTSTKCYYSDSPYLSNVTFVPAENYTGTFSISYSGRSNARDLFSGSVEITVHKSGSTISYSVAPGKTVSLDDSDFNDYCKDTTSYNMEYVKLTPPSSSRGTLYYRYGESRYEEKVSSSDKYYRSSSPRLDDVSFLADSGYTGTVSIPFTGESTNGTKFSGTMKIRVGDGTQGDITYTASAGSAVTFSDGQFNDYCKDMTDYSLDYVRFTLPSSSKGTLYYQYDKSGEKKASSTTSYYRSSSPRLEDITFVPAKDFSGTVEISFTGRNTNGGSLSGTVVISYATLKDPSVIRYSTTSAPVTFQSKDFQTACDARGAGSLSTVKFDLPSTSMGKLYYGYTSPSKYSGLVMPGISFPADNSVASLSAVTFVPKAGYNGTVPITYTGTDSKGNTYTGQISITVTPSTQSKRFNDMGSHGWAAASVDFLYDGGVTTGTSATTYGPSLSITRGDFVLMLYRAFNLSANATDGFKDVPSNSYYAQAISVAKALGIAQGSDDGRFNPTAPLTREDAMVFLYRTLNRTGRTIASASTAYLNRFSDGGSTSGYAQESVAALAQAGIIQGDTNGRLNPKGSLTRAEMAVILHRVLTL